MVSELIAPSLMMSALRLVACKVQLNSTESQDQFEFSSSFLRIIRPLCYHVIANSVSFRRGNDVTVINMSTEVRLQLIFTIVLMKMVAFINNNSRSL